MIEDDLLDLPEDPELQLVEYERRLRKRMWDNISDSESLRYDHDQKVHYVTKLMAFHDAHNFAMLERPCLIRNSQEFDAVFDGFTDEVNYWTTQIEVRHVQRLRPITTILSLTDDVKRQIHSYINKIRDAIGAADLKIEKKEVLHARLNALADEVDRDRTKTEAWTAFVLEVASTGGRAAEELKPVRRLADSIGNLLGKAKEIAERMRLPSPTERKRIESPRKRLPARDEPKQAPSYDDLDDEIPF